MPVPVPHSPMHVIVKINPLIGTSQRTGLLFFPEVCRGSSTVVCRSGPLYKANVHQCARGLVFNQTDLIHHCKFDLAKGDNRTIIKSLGDDRYALSTWGELLKNVLGRSSWPANWHLGLMNSDATHLVW